MEPLVLYQIVKRALEPRLSTLMGPLAAILWKPSGQDEQTSQAQSPVVLHRIASSLQVYMGGMLRQQRQTCTKPMQTTGTQAHRVTQLQSGPKAHACELSCCEDSCAPFFAGHVNTWPPCQTTACAAFSCAIYPNHALLNVKVSNSIDATQIAAQNLPGLGGQTFPLIVFDHFPASLSLACPPVKKRGKKAFQETMPATIDPPTDTCDHELTKSQPPLE